MVHFVCVCADMGGGGMVHSVCVLMQRGGGGHGALCVCVC